MSEYLILAETIIFKNERLTCINVHNNFKTVAMPAEFNFDMAILCGPKWSIGDHKLSVKAVASNGKEIDLGAADVKIPHEDFVYNAFLNNIRIVMDYSISDLTFYVYDNGKELFSRKYPVLPMLVPQRVKNDASASTAPKETDAENSAEAAGRFGTSKKPKFTEFYKLKTKKDIKEAQDFINSLPDDYSVKARLQKIINKQKEAIK